MIERVLKTISRYNMLAPGARVAVAVSGGADSVCLLHVLHEIGVPLTGVAHFNHKLRGEDSDRDERSVAEMAVRLGLEFHRAEADLKAAAGNLEQAARRARHEFFTRLIRDGVADRIAVGHTRNDQAETVLFRVLRGSGLAGLSGIHPATTEGIVRPLLDVTRDEVEEFLRARAIPWREDATNTDTRFARNRIRHELLPQLEREWNPALGDALAKLADLANEEEAWWTSEIDRLAARLLVETAGGIELRAEELAALPRSVARRLVRYIIGCLKGDLRGIEFDHVEQALALDRRLRLPGVDVRRSFDWLRFAAPSTPLLRDPVEVKVPGSFATPDGSSRVCFEVAESKRTSESCGTLKAEFYWLRIPSHLVLRGWRPGDHYRPLGQSRDQKVKQMFQNARVPSWRRASWPILTGGERILWARDFGPADEFAWRPEPSGEAGPVLQIWETGY